MVLQKKYFLPIQTTIPEEARGEINKKNNNKPFKSMSYSELMVMALQSWIFTSHYRIFMIQ